MQCSCSGSAARSFLLSAQNKSTLTIARGVKEAGLSVSSLLSDLTSSSSSIPVVHHSPLYAKKESTFSALGAFLSQSPAHRITAGCSHESIFPYLHEFSTESFRRYHTQHFPEEIICIKFMRNPSFSRVLVDISLLCNRGIL